MGKIFDDITQTIGNTPLVRLSRVSAGIDAVILGKIESFNPLGSIKDRLGLAMIEDAEKKGKLKKGGVIIEPTSGNTGVGLAFVAAVKEYRLIITMPDTMSIERIKLMEFLGAEVVLTQGAKGMKGAIEQAELLAQKIPGSIILQQFSNPVNPEVHRRTTAEEIWNDTEGKIDILVAGVGTGGSLTGISELIKSRKPSVQSIAVEPDSCAVLSGGKPGVHKIQGIGAGFVPDILNRDIIDEVVRVRDQDACQTTRLLAKKEGILAGISSGAALWAAMQVGRRIEHKGKTMVVILPDTGERYLSTWLFGDD